jgi:hypothetical protein
LQFQALNGPKETRRPPNASTPLLIINAAFRKIKRFGEKKFSTRSTLSRAAETNKSDDSASRFGKEVATLVKRGVASLRKYADATVYKNAI